MKNKTFKSLFNPYLLFFVSSVLSAVIFDYSADSISKAGKLVFISLFVILLAFAVYSYINKQLSAERIAFIIASAAFLVNLIYVLQTGLTERQHDIGTFRTGSASHSGYIYRLYSEKSLPDSASGQFYHPPLHYIFESIWLGLLDFIGISFEKATHYVTVLTLFYSSAATFTAYRIFTETGISKKVSTIIYALTAFHPTFIILSASYNNDILSVLFMLLAILYAVKWYKTPKWSRIILCAVFVGAGMMSKLSAAYVALPIAALFIVKFFTESKKLRLLGQYALFGSISIPLGMWWSVRLLIKFGKPIGYVMKLSADHEQYVGFRTVSERLFDIGKSFSQGIYVARGEKFGNDFFEYNIPSAVLKGSVFGEWHIGEGNTFTEILAYGLLIINTLLVIYSLYCLFRTIFRKTPCVSGIYKVMYILFYAFMMVMYVRFCLTFEHDCTMDFRYIVPTVFTGAAFIGMNYISAKKVEKYITVSLVSVFSVISVLLYCFSA